MAKKYFAILRGFVTLMLLQNPSTAQDPLLGEIYPDVVNCFQGVERNLENDPIRWTKGYKQICIELENNPDENSLCFKACMLRRRYVIDNLAYPPRDDDLIDRMIAEDKDEVDISLMIEERRQGTNYTVDPDSVADQVGRNILGIEKEVLMDESNKQKYNHVKERVEVCKGLEFLVPKPNDDCKNMAPEHQDKLSQFVACIENALNCET